MENKNQNKLILDYQNSIVLPTFDIASILKNNTIIKITLSLYLLEIQNSSNNIHITINPFDFNTGKVDNGLSSYINPRLKQYTDFELPIELFEGMVNSTKRLLIRLVDMNSKLVFDGPDNTGIAKDPKLVVTYSEAAFNIDDSASLFIKDPQFYNVKIKNLQVYFSDKNNITNSKPFWSTLLGQIIIGLIVSGLLYLISLLF